MSFSYCEKCWNRKKDEVECKYMGIIEYEYGDEFTLISCPDQQEQNRVDLLFKNKEGKTLEVEVKTINIGLGEENYIAYDKFIKLAQIDLKEIVNSCVALNVKIGFKKKLTEQLYNNKVKCLFVDIENTDIDNAELPLQFENDYCQVVIDILEPELAEDAHLVFTIPFREEPNIIAIQDAIRNTEQIISEVKRHVQNEKFSTKFKDEQSEKITIFAVKYNSLLNSFIEIFDKAFKTDHISIVLNKIDDNLNDVVPFGTVILCYDDIDSETLRYLISRTNCES